MGEGEGMKIHDLKCWPDFFQAIWDGLKTFEIRKNDRDYQAGDILIDREYIKRTNTYTGRIIEAEVTYLLGGLWPGLAKDYVCMAINVIGKIGHGEGATLPDFCDKCGQHFPLRRGKGEPMNRLSDKMYGRLLYRLIEIFPTFDPVLSSEIQEKWIDLFFRLLELVDREEIEKQKGMGI